MAEVAFCDLPPLVISHGEHNGGSRHHFPGVCALGATAEHAALDLAAVKGPYSMRTLCSAKGANSTRTRATGSLASGGRFVRR